ncbi:MAG: biotin transporter BioY [Hyphomicrobiales bacterium]|nr:biotin transporter BioY [Hyphomicrobiales bacterium]MDE2016994.1 biotin transporter BioY [Hyphomicrobiales bacterium]
MRDASSTALPALLPKGAVAPWASRAALALAGTAALALSAKVQVPFYPVPMTMQTLVVLAIGATYGLRLATATLALYLAEGFLGLPVFAGAVAGPAYMVGPTGGYLIGFLAAAAALGFAADRGWLRRAPSSLGWLAGAHALVFAFGFAWLARLIGPQKAWIAGVAPFYAATALKTVLAWMGSIGWTAWIDGRARG